MMKENTVTQGDIAIIGMACIFPKAPDLQTYWQNIVSKVDAIAEVPLDRWSIDSFYDADVTAEDRLHCKRGGYLPGSMPFNPLDYGIMPVALNGAEPDQFLQVKLVYDALADAGHPEQTIDRRRVEVIQGKGNYLGAGHANLIQKAVVTEQTLGIIQDLHPEFTDDDLKLIKKELQSHLRPFNAETASSLIPNLATGRVTNRLDFMGSNYTIDAACASSLIATEIGVQDLLTGKYDLSVIGGAHICNDIPFLTLFSSLGAVSPRSKIQPFDEAADGTIPGEGIGVILLKRLADAERDGDRIYAVIKGVGSASDGRGLSVTAPRVEGEELALQRAYEMARIDPQTVELIEAHGTGTAVGDAAEVEALHRVFGTREEGTHPWCALGAVKSMIGHCFPASGVAGMMKAILALYHKILPPTLNVENPLAQLRSKDTPFYINTETRPWIHGRQDVPRRAGVNAFGFGGINAHVILEEYQKLDELNSPRIHTQWDSEVFIFSGTSRSAVIERAQHVHAFLANSPDVPLKDLAYTLNVEMDKAPYRLSIVATSAEELGRKLHLAIERLQDTQRRQIKDMQGIYFFEEPLGGKLAFMFPGEGAQYLNMLADLCLHFPEVRLCFDQIDQAFVEQQRGYLPSSIIFPIPSFSKEERVAAEARLWEMDGALEAVLTANWALSKLLSALQIEPDMVVGHSSGEFSAMLAAGVAEVDDAYFRNISILNEHYKRAASKGEIPEAVMIAAGVGYKTASAIVNHVGGNIYVAMNNCPHQTVIVGEKAAGEQVIEQLRARGILYEKLPFNRAYHTPMFEETCKKLHAYFDHVPMRAPKTEIYSCWTVKPFPTESEAIQNIVVDHWMHPVKFQETIETMYEAGARIFVEIGPRGNLTAFVDDILRGKPHLAMPSNLTSRLGVTQLNHLVGILAAQGVPMNLERLYALRSPVRLSLELSKAPLEEKPHFLKELRLDFPSMHLSEEISKRLIKHTDHKTAVQEPAITSVTSVPSPKTAQPVKASQQPKLTNGQTGAQKSTTPSPVSAASPKTPHPRTTEKQNMANQRTFPVSPGQHQDSGSPEVVNRNMSQVTPARQVGPAASQVMQQYLQTMENFLGVQEQIMQAYINGTVPFLQPTEWKNGSKEESKEGRMEEWKNGRAPSLLPVLPFLPVETPVDMPEIPRPVHSDNVSVSPAEAELELVSPITTDADESGQKPALERSEGTSVQEMAEALLQLVSEKTGYPIEMLDVNLDMEADLGIDSIKRTEVLGAFQEKYGNLTNQAMDETFLEEIARLKTLQQVIDFIEMNIEASGGHASSPNPPVPFPGGKGEPSPPHLRGGAGGEVGRGASSPLSSATAVDTRSYPFIDSVSRFVPGQELVVTRRINWEGEDIFLEDHTFGPEISGTDETLKGLPVIPLTGSIEIMAEAATLFMQPKQLVRMKDIRAHQWIQVENPVTLEIIIKRVGPEEVTAELWGADDPAAKTLFLEGKMEFADSFPQPPAVSPEFSLTDERTPERTAEQIYQEHYLFHGPRFHNIVQMERMGSDGLVGYLEVLPIDNLFRSNPKPFFIADPFLFDAVGQLVGYWPLENLETGFLIFPIRVKEVQLYCPTRPVSERVKCHLRIREITSTQIRADIDVIRPNGQLWMRVIGWEDWRFYFPRNLFDFWRFPNKGMVSTSWDAPLSTMPPHVAKTLECFQLTGFWELQNTIWETVWAYLIANRQERKAYWQLKEKKADKRRMEWLFGRTAAKDAVRVYIQKRFSKALYPADIEIVPDEYGKPMVCGEWTEDLPVPSITLTHTGKTAVALVGPYPYLGIDIEQMGHSQTDVESHAFTQAEQVLLKGLTPDVREEWRLRLWCSKEAVGKAFGRGVLGQFKNIVVQSFEVDTGVVQLRLRGELSEIYPDFADASIIAYTIRANDFILAVSLGEKA